MRRFDLVVSLSILVSSVPCQLEPVQRHMKAAEKAQAAGEAEVAALELHQAFWALRLVPKSMAKELKAAEREITLRLRRIDPGSVRLLAAQERAAANLEKFALQYLRAGRERIAARVAAQLLAISPYLLDADLRGLVGVGGPTGAGDNQDIVAWFRGGATPYDDEEWKIDAREGVTSPQFARDQSWNAILVSKRKLRGDFSVRLEVDITRVVRAGVCLGVRGDPRPTSFVLLEIDPQLGELIVSHLVGNKLEWLGTAKMDVPQQSGWCGIELKVAGRDLVARFGDRKSGVEVKLPAAVDGAVGLYCTCKRGRPGPARYRFFQVTQPGGLGDKK